MTMTLVETIEVGAGGAASISFTSIPQDGTDLVLKFSLRSSGGDNVCFLRFNGSTSNYSNRYLNGTGSSVSSGTDTSIYQSIATSSSTANTFSSGLSYIANYAVSQNKSVSSDSVNENNATGARQLLVAGLWSDTSAITSLSLVLAGNNFVENSTASLYKITKA